MDEGSFVGKDKQWVIFPVKCKEYTARCSFNLLSWLKEEKLARTEKQGEELFYMKV